MNGLICFALGFIPGVFVGYTIDTMISIYRQKKFEKELLQNMQHMKTGLLLMAHLERKRRMKIEEN